jgi:hypothetical protein
MGCDSVKFVKVDTNVPQNYAAFIFNICPEQRSIMSARNVGIRIQQYEHILTVSTAKT